MYMSEQRQHTRFKLLKDPECRTDQDLNRRPPDAADRRLSNQANGRRSGKLSQS